MYPLQSPTLEFACQHCGAPVGQRCTWPNGGMRSTHVARVDAWRCANAETPKPAKVRIDEMLDSPAMFDPLFGSPNTCKRCGRARTAHGRIGKCPNA